MSQESLRERKKRETRRRLHHAALDLAVRDGLHGVTVEAIASHADVSPRTFFNYFPTKEAAIVGAAPDLGERLAAAFADRPTGEPIALSLRVVLTDHLVAAAADPELREHRKRLTLSHPELAVAMAGMTRAAQDALTREVSNRLGVDGDADPYPRLAVGIAFAAVSAALAVRHARRADPADMRADLDAVFDMVDACPNPPSPATGGRSPFPQRCHQGG